MIFLSLLAIALPGAGLVAWGFPERAATSADRALRISIAAALGLGSWSAAYAAARMTGLPPAAKDVFLVAAGAALLFFSRGRPRAEEAPGEAAPRWLWTLFLVASAVSIGGFIEHDWRFPDGGWDAWMIWNLRARFLVRDPDLRAAFSPNLLLWAHADYPWLVPGAVAQGFLLAGRETKIVPLGIAVAFGVLAVSVISLAVTRLYGARWGLLAALAVLTVPAFPIFVSNQQSDIPLGVYLGCAGALIVLAYARAERPLRMLMLAGFATGLGAWTKNEGALYAVCLALGLLARTRDLRGTLAFAAGVVPAGLLFLGFKLAYAPANDLTRLSTSAGVIAHALDPLRWGELLLYSLRRIVFFQAFALFLLAEVVVLAVWVRRLPGTPVGTALFLATAAVLPIYLLQPHPLHWLFRTSVDRIIFQLWPTAVLATIAALASAVVHPSRTPPGFSTVPGSPPA
jgi:hypothetical protein